MRRHVVIDKKIGETPLTALRAWQTTHPKEASLPASYAGRLDPMASGKLLILLGEECKRQKEYTRLDKEYDIEVLLGVGSDTGDILGIPTYAEYKSFSDKKKISAILRPEHGKHLRPYPIFSSKTVRGKPLFLYALEGTLSSITIPEHEEHIYHVQHIETTHWSSVKLQERVMSLLSRVPRTDEPSKRLGEDFRVDTIRSKWQHLSEQASSENFTILRLRVTCASGTYMRSLAERIGVSLGTRALALSITRTKIGTYIPLWRGRGVWRHTF